MTLSDLIFVFGFFPIYFAFYYLSQNKYRKYVLMVGSIFFYYVSDSQHMWVIALMTIFTYVIAKFIDSRPEHKKVYMWLGVIGNLLPLFLYRYLDFSVASLFGLFQSENVWQMNIAGIPLGISFITFSVISYICDVYNDKIKAEKNFISVVAYIWMFPKIIMGPIERYSDIRTSFDNPELNITNALCGIKRFIVGFCKKIIIADNLAIIVKQIFTLDDPTIASTPMLWLGAVCFSLELFYDFAGYSDMAIGMASIFGFKFKENFDYPYISKSITEFWRRWHISLSSWFRDYVYIPLGGSRMSAVRNILNLFAVWLLTGIWHGVGYKFIFWGLVYFVMLLIERYVLKLKKQKNIAIKVIWTIITLLVINFNWVIFNAQSLKIGIKYCLSMVGYYGINNSISPNFIKDIREYGVYIVMAVVFSTPIVPFIQKKLSVRDKHGVISIIETLGYVIAFMWAVSFILLGAHSPFLYQKF